jgi:hypothetical protein
MDERQRMRQATSMKLRWHRIAACAAIGVVVTVAIGIVSAVAIPPSNNRHVTICPQEYPPHSRSYLVTWRSTAGVRSITLLAPNVIDSEEAALEDLFQGWRQPSYVSMPLSPHSGNTPQARAYLLRRQYLMEAIVISPLAAIRTGYAESNDGCSGEAPRARDSLLGYDPRHRVLWAAVMDESHGWPWLSLSSTTRVAPLSAAAPHSDVAVEHGIMLGEPAEFWHLVSSKPGTSVLSRWRVVPLRPKWSGFIFSTLFWGIGFACLHKGSTSVTRWRRRKRGRCMDCGYLLVGAAGCRCPECGA